MDKTQTGGVGLLGLLLIAFIVLKLVGVIDWSWVWVLAPLWIPFAVFAVIFIVIILVVIIKNVVEEFGK